MPGHVRQVRKMLAPANQADYFKKRREAVSGKRKLEKSIVDPEFTSHPRLGADSGDRRSAWRRRQYLRLERRFCDLQCGAATGRYI